MLHESLLELHDNAGSCADTATLKGVLAEVLDLARNAIEHNSPAAAVSRWIADTVTAALHSPAAVSLMKGGTVVVADSWGRGCGLPSIPISWCAVVAEANPHAGSCLPADTTPADGFETLARIVRHAGYDVTETPLGLSPAATSVWIERVNTAVVTRNSHQLGLFADAGNFLTPALHAHVDHRDDIAHCLLTEAVRHRPPTLRAVGGLPDRDAPVDVMEHLIKPLAEIARWAGFVAGSTATSTLERIAIASDEGILRGSEAEYLVESWSAACSLALTRWCDGYGTDPEPWSMLPQIHRSVYGDACRSVSASIRSAASRHGLVLGD